MLQHLGKEAIQVIDLLIGKPRELHQAITINVARSKSNPPVPEPRGAGRAMRIQQLATSVNMSGLRHAAGPRTRRM